MSLWRQLTRGLHALTHPTAADQDVADEVHHYLEQATAAHVARGLSPGQAARAARLELGSVLGVRDQVRRYGWENHVEALFADLRFAVRRLRAAPGFTVVAVLTLALGIGATAAIFSAVNPILFKPLPYPDGGRVTMIWYRGDDGSRVDQTFGTYRELMARSRSFAAIAAMKSWQPTLIGAAEPARLDGQRVSWSYFRVLGIPPALGRSFQPSDDQLNGPNVAILSDSLWRRRFGGDRTIIGRPITLDENLYIVIGVMPKAFENVLAPSAELWAPLQYDMSQGRAWGHHLRIVGRLRSGIGIGPAGRELDAIAHAPVQELPRMPWASLKDGLIVTPLQDDVTAGVKPALLAILGAAALVLVIACVNVTNLVLARGVQRRGELALRTALGAGRSRLIRQLLTESLLLAALGGVAGLAVALLGVRALVALSPAGLPRAGAIAVDGPVLAFGLIVTTLIGLAVGSTPALQAVREDPHPSLQSGSQRTAGGFRMILGGRTRSALVVAEVALALVLLVSSGLLLRSAQRLFAVAPGFAPSHLLTMQVQTSGHRFDAAGVTFRFFDQALAAVRRVPGVTAAALTSQLPLSGDSDLYGVHFDPPPAADPGEVKGSFRYAVSPGYFETMRIPLRKGRLFEDREMRVRSDVVVVSEAFARKFFPRGDAIGRRVKIDMSDEPSATEIVGIVGDVHHDGLIAEARPIAYWPHPQLVYSAMTLTLRTDGDPARLAGDLERAVQSADKDQPVSEIRSMEQWIATSLARSRFSSTLLAVFAALALLLAAVGIYGVMSYVVGQRRSEIGIRLALGATEESVLRMVVAGGARLVLTGILIGIPAAVLLSRFLAALLYETSSTDPATIAAVAGALGGVAVVASWVPAWRASRVAPVEALRGS